MKQDFQINFLREMGLEPHHYLIDLGCGTLRGGVPLIEYLDLEHYFGIEARQEVFDEGRKELNKFQLEHKKPSLTVAEDLNSLELHLSFDYIWSFSVLIHKNDNILNNALEFVSRHLKEGNYFYTNVNISD